ncbi:DUF3102 domain-containing protein [Mesorhizobium sp. M7A.F.Ca.US.010.02.1.1]|uniref:DUF3102 domain-containing protein n=1 Tax=Mesorhizobium sp. M7A.F.Ca.US.010.02.1.1 TaxID=2496743 RepID=UPI0013E2C644|nr:DUF3102 domain-containing protein [Mesorhizobium sp. M7A.F.Ca.US.010.02.1.1]
MQPPDMENPAPRAGGNRADFESSSVQENSENPGDRQGAMNSNRLPVLAAEIKNASVVFAQAQRMSADCIIVMGKSLVEAKELCAHGEWTGFLKAAGISPRSAQRYMRIVKSGIGSDYLSIVGLTDALDEIDAAVAAMPDPGWATFISYENEDGPPDVMMWWSTGSLTGGFLQTWKNYEEPDSHTCLIVESMPVFYIAFIAEVMASGIEGNNPRRQIVRQSIPFSERDEKIAFARSEIARYRETRP